MWSSSLPTQLPRALSDLAHEQWLTEDDLRPAVELGAAAAARSEHRRSRRPCYPRAISSGHQRYPADNHGQFEEAGGWAWWRLRFRPSPEAQAWRRAADGERFVARLLDPLAKQGWGVEHDLPVRGATANLDHVVIGPPGIFAIDVRHYRGRLRLSHDGLLWHGRTFLLPTLSTIRSKADRLQDRIGAPDVAVSPIVAVLGGMVPGGQATSMGVTVVSARRLPGLLRNLPPNLTTERAREVAAQMNQRLDAEPAPEQPGNELRLEY